ncbi:class I SAM-dependent methyltransferase [Desulfoplanes formicivorans]|uniref:Methyltransferase domain-containing protein n=1 Tax=Desulfoplanes formicivorans TaxID=1592317 RepID=A0A194AE55_9BACT|nr:class I SAM-dependent methyltransferase [Desulfoplanes formicivorans]GAU07613.1 hypothetical protein DPF_0303 [Desulfoplanes formicivorans]
MIPPDYVGRIFIAHQFRWGKKGFAGRLHNYKNETFYTTTPIPFYYKRRNIVLKKFLKNLTNCVHVCDFGCGDGFYISFLNSASKRYTLYGIDISQGMINIAQKKCPFANFIVSNNVSTNQQKFDAVYSIAVFAHILSDEQIKKYLKIFTILYLQKENLFYLNRRVRKTDLVLLGVEENLMNILSSLYKIIFIFMIITSFVSLLIVFLKKKKKNRSFDF